MAFILDWARDRAPRAQLEHFLDALGYCPGDTVYLRLLPAKGFWPNVPKDATAEQKAANAELKADQAKVFPELFPGGIKLKLQGDRLCKKIGKTGDYKEISANPTQWLIEQNQLGWCPYIVVNPGGDNKVAITGARAIFWESDHKSKADQIAQFAAVNERWGGGFAVETANSIHCYIRLDRELSPELIEPTLRRVIAKFDSDTSIKDPSRLMRLPGFDHIKMNGVEVIRTPITLIHEWDGTFASWDQIDNDLPQLEEAIAITDRRLGKAPKRAKTPTKAIAKPATTVNLSSGGGDLQAFLKSEVYPRLGPEQIFNDPSHNWQPKSGDRLEGGCPWHESTTGRAAWCDRTSDGVTWHYNCNTCYGGEGDGLNPIGYRYALRGGSGQPTGRDFVEIVRELAADVGVSMPERSKADQQQHQAAGQQQGDRKFVWDGKLLKHVRQLKSGDTQTTLIGNFDIRIQKTLAPYESGSISAQELEVLYWHNGPRSKAIILDSDVKTKGETFVKAIAKQVSAGLTANFRGLLSEYLIERDFEHQAAGGQISHLIDRVGIQPDGSAVFSGACFDKDGKAIAPDDSAWTWNPDLGRDLGLPKFAIAPQDPEALTNWAIAATSFYPESHHPYLWFKAGTVVQSLHRDKLIESREGNAPLNAHSLAQCLKSSMAAAAMSLVGWLDAPKGDVTTAWLSRTGARLSGLPIFLDDAIKPGGDPKQVEQQRQALVGWCRSAYDGTGPGKVGSNEPVRSTALITTNLPIVQGGDAAAETRILLLHVPTLDGAPNEVLNLAIAQEFKQACVNASGGLSQLLQVPYLPEKVAEIYQAIAPHFGNTLGRLTQAWAIKIYFTQALCKLCGVEFDATEFAIRVIAPQAAALETAKDPLTDFLQKLRQLEASRKVGPWLMTKVSRRNGNRAQAIWMPEAWRVVEKEFPLSYSKDSVFAAAAKLGAEKGAAKFVADSETWTRYLDDKNSAARNGGPAPSMPLMDQTQKALLVPLEIWEQAIACEEDEEGGPIVQVEAVQANSRRSFKTQLEPGDHVDLKAGLEIEYRDDAGQQVQAASRLSIAGVRVHEHRKVFECYVLGRNTRVDVWATDVQPVGEVA